MCDTVASTLVAILLYIFGVLVSLRGERGWKILLNEVHHHRWVAITINVILIFIVINLKVLYLWGCNHYVWAILLLAFFAFLFSLLAQYISDEETLASWLGTIAFRAFRKGRSEEVWRYLWYLRLIGKETHEEVSKIAVIRALGRVASKTMSLKSYDGNSLTELILTMKDVLSESSHPSWLVTFIVAVEELDRILHTYREHFSPEMHSKVGEQDPIAAAKALSDIGSEALRHYPNTGLADAVLDTLQRHTWLGPRATQALVEIAATAVKYHHPEVTISALLSIEQVLYDEGIDDKNRVMLYDYIGALSLVSSYCGVAGKRFAERAWGEFCAGESPITCKHYAIGAYDHHAQSGRFALADAIHHTFIAPSSPLPKSLAPSIP